MGKFSSIINVEQIEVPGSDPKVYLYKVKSLANRTTPVVGSTLNQEEMNTLLADTTIRVNVRL